MESPMLHQQVSQFEERNNFLYFVLGLLSVSATLTQRLTGEAAPAPMPEELRQRDEAVETAPTDLLS